MTFVKIAGLACAAAIGMAILGWSPGQGPDVPNFPTPPAAVEAMLKLAEVTKDDVVYDLGCGDGRIVVAAARRFGARGVGVDLDPQCVRDSRENARKAHVENRVTFERRDIFKTDISGATVVALYLSPELNRRLVPKLLKELKPGSRVVAHVYDMGDWEPDKTIPVPDSKQFKLFLWTIPAQVGGVWRWTGTTPAGRQSDRLHLTQRYQKISGTIGFGGSQLRVSSGEVRGNQLRLHAEGSQEPTTADLTAVVKGPAFSGTLDVNRGGALSSIAITGRRESGGPPSSRSGADYRSRTRSSIAAIWSLPETTPISRWYSRRSPGSRN